MTEGRRLLLLWLAASPGRSQRVLAKRCGVAWGAIGALASGAHRTPSLALAAALEHHAGVSMRAWLMETPQLLTEVSTKHATLSVVR